MDQLPAGETAGRDQIDAATRDLRAVRDAIVARSAADGEHPAFDPTGAELLALAEAARRIEDTVAQLRDRRRAAEEGEGDGHD